MKYSVVAILSLFVSINVLAKEVTTNIGQWDYRYGGKIQLSVIDKDGKKNGVFYVTDEYIVETNYFSTSKEDLLEIRALIDKTIKELGRP